MMRIVLFGASGTIGRATAAALLARGHSVLCPLRTPCPDLPTGAETCAFDLATLPAQFQNTRPHAIVSCLASRSGAPADAWAIDHDAHQTILSAAQTAGVRQMVLLSAICVQRPKLAFQKAKLAFETALAASGLTYSIVRPTAFFKSLSGQVARVQAGKPFLMFGDGTLTACKPISDADLATYLADCLTNPALHNRILPIGGPGPALTPRDQAQMLAQILGRPVPTRRVPVALLSTIIALLSALAPLSPRLRAKAELARIGRYYATESMLVWNPATHSYDAKATPETGTDTLADHYARLLRGDTHTDLRDHAVF